QHPDGASLLIENDHRARAEATAGLFDRLEIHGDIEMLLDEKSGGGAAGQKRAKRKVFTHATGMLLEDFPDRRPHRKLPRPRALHMAAGAIDLGAAVRAARQAAEPSGAPIDDVRHVDQRFDIVDDRGLAPQSAGLREGRLCARDRALAFERREQRRLLAADVTSGTGVEMKLEVKARAENLLAEIALGVCFS